MATVNGNIADIISEEDGHAGESPTGRYVTHAAAASLLDQAVEGPLYFLRARDTGVGGVAWVFWFSSDPVSSPPSGYVGPLTNKAAIRVNPRRGVLPILMENGEVMLME